MKKVFSVCLAAGLMFSMVACGTSQEDAAKQEQDVRNELNDMMKKAEDGIKSGDSTNTNSTDTSHAGHGH